MVPRIGILWEGRYKASLINSERYLLRCCRYSELNPVRAKDMVEHPIDYRWSSYHSNALGEYEPVLMPHPIYLALGNTNQERQAAYQALFDDQMDSQGLTEIRDSLNQCRVLGGEAFKTSIFYIPIIGYIK